MIVRIREKLINNINQPDLMPTQTHSRVEVGKGGRQFTMIPCVTGQETRALFVFGFTGLAYGRCDDGYRFYLFDQLTSLEY